MILNHIWLRSVWKHYPVVHVPIVGVRFGVCFIWNNMTGSDIDWSYARKMWLGTWMRNADKSNVWLTAVIPYRPNTHLIFSWQKKNNLNFEASNF